MKFISTLLISFVIATLTCNKANAEVPTLVKQFISTSSDSSTLKETVQGCTATSINYAAMSKNTIANLYSDGSFELGYGNADNDLIAEEGDNIILTGIWSSIDAAGTKFRFQPNGNLALGNADDGYGTLGWLKIYTWTKENACVAQSNQYNLTYPSTFRIVKSDMTLKTSNNSGTLRFTVEGHGQTTATEATPPKTLPIMRYDMQAKGFWYSIP
jgi:hypothetical protein